MYYREKVSWDTFLLRLTWFTKYVDIIIFLLYFDILSDHYVSKANSTNLYFNHINIIVKVIKINNLLIDVVKTLHMVTK